MVFVVLELGLKPMGHGAKERERGEDDKKREGKRK